MEVEAEALDVEVEKKQKGYNTEQGHINGM